MIDHYCSGSLKQEPGTVDSYEELDEELDDVQCPMSNRNDAWTT